MASSYAAGDIEDATLDSSYATAATTDNGVDSETASLDNSAVVNGHISEASTYADSAYKAETEASSAAEQGKNAETQALSEAYAASSAAHDADSIAVAECTAASSLATSITSGHTAECDKASAASDAARSASVVDSTASVKDNSAHEFASTDSSVAASGVTDAYNIDTRYPGHPTSTSLATVASSDNSETADLE